MAASQARADVLCLAARDGWTTGRPLAQIFISYASEDKHFARRVATALEARGWRVWWDRHIPPGMDYARVIEQAVAAADCVVVLWSRHSVGSRWVAIEAGEGVDRDIAATAIIDRLEVGDLPFEFRRLQAVRLSDWHDGLAHEGFDQLVARIASIIGPPASTVVPDNAPETSAGRDRAGWSAAFNSWGTGRQPAYRAAGVITLLLALGLLLFVPDDVFPLGPVLAFMAAAIGLLFFHQSRGVS